MVQWVKTPAYIHSGVRVFFLILQVILKEKVKELNLHEVSCFLSILIVP